MPYVLFFKMIFFPQLFLHTKFYEKITIKSYLSKHRSLNMCFYYILYRIKLFRRNQIKSIYLTVLLVIRVLLVRRRWRTDIGVRTKYGGFLKRLFLLLKQVVFCIWKVYQWPYIKINNIFGIPIKKYIRQLIYFSDLR